MFCLVNDNDSDTKGYKMNDDAITPNCLECARDSSATPLLSLEYQGDRLWICPQHLPVLIHDPARLVGKLAGAENLRPAEHND